MHEFGITTLCIKPPKECKEFDDDVETKFIKKSVEICNILGADFLIYNDLNDVIEACRKLNENISSFETSCFENESKNENSFSCLENSCFDFESSCF
jgi:hypothetical protein